MPIRVIPISELRGNINTIINEIGNTNKTYCIVKNSRAVAIIVGIKYFNSILERLEELGEHPGVKFGSQLTHD